MGATTCERGRAARLRAGAVRPTLPKGIHTRAPPGRATGRAGQTVRDAVAECAARGDARTPSHARRRTHAVASCANVGVFGQNPPPSRPISSKNTELDGSRPPGSFGTRSAYRTMRWPPGTLGIPYKSRSRRKYGKSLASAGEKRSMGTPYTLMRDSRRRSAI